MIPMVVSTIFGTIAALKAADITFDSENIILIPAILGILFGVVVSPLYFKIIRTSFETLKEFLTELFVVCSTCAFFFVGAVTTANSYISLSDCKLLDVQIKDKRVVQGKYMKREFKIEKNGYGHLSLSVSRNTWDKHSIGDEIQLLVCKGVFGQWIVKEKE